jgi:hypothetical protein
MDDDTLPNTTLPTDATLFREEAARARRYAAAMTDKKVILTDFLDQFGLVHSRAPSSSFAVTAASGSGCKRLWVTATDRESM